MIIKPRVRGFICTTSHPKGCEKNVQTQIDYVKSQKHSEKHLDKPDNFHYKNVLIIGGSTGYGLAARIAAAYLLEANTLNVCLEKPPKENKTASAGWYNTYAFEKIVREDEQGELNSKPPSSHQSVLGDAFSNQTKEETIKVIKEKLGSIDLLIYSLAAPQRKDPTTGQTYKSVLKPIGEAVKSKGIDVQTGQLTELNIPPASEEEIKSTIKVMGGEDWQLWIDFLKKENLLGKNFLTIAFSYIGPEVTKAVYRDGTIGRAKIDLEETCSAINDQLSGIGGRALVSINKAIVTQAAAAIPILPLYLSILYRVMKSKALHEGCIEQMTRLINEKLKNHPMEENKIFLDDYEMREEVQNEVKAIWQSVTNENLKVVTDLAGYQDDFLNLFGFGLEDVDYEMDVEQELMLKI